jgi:DNA-binding response OmpR family regulator
VKLPNFRTALVIANDCGLRKSVVQHLKYEGWIVHGITKAEHALAILAHIPYELIIVDCELAGIDGKDFVRLLHNASDPAGEELPSHGGFDRIKRASF